jgi:hypothetical protein
MATCGYLCPACEGRGYDDNANVCNWCTIENPPVKKEKNIEDENPTDLSLKEIE